VASEAGTSVLLVEQQAATALRVADFVYVVSGGRIAMSSSATDLQRRWGEIEMLYMSN
jgi:ABC-type branched-subunit amino acid transport system ATPase component